MDTQESGGCSRESGRESVGPRSLPSLNHLGGGGRAAPGVWQGWTSGCLACREPPSRFFLCICGVEAAAASACPRLILQVFSGSVPPHGALTLGLS